jgi:hypothetical protein
MSQRKRRQKFYWQFEVEYDDSSLRWDPDKFFWITVAYYKHGLIRGHGRLGTLPQ